MRVLGIDYGAKRIGVALGDTDSKIATPWKVIEVEGLADQVGEIRDCYQHEGASALVVGIPYTHLGQEGEQAEATRSFIKILRAEGFTVHEVDERLSTRLADTHARESGRKGATDDLAAAVLLETWLEQYGVSS